MDRVCRPSENYHETNWTIAFLTNKKLLHSNIYQKLQNFFNTKSSRILAIWREIYLQKRAKRYCRLIVSPANIYSPALQKRLGRAT